MLAQAKPILLHCKEDGERQPEEVHACMEGGGGGGCVSILGKLKMSVMIAVMNTT